MWSTRHAWKDPNEGPSWPPPKKGSLQSSQHSWPTLAHPASSTGDAAPHMLEPPPRSKPTPTQLVSLSRAPCGTMQTSCEASALSDLRSKTKSKPCQNTLNFCNIPSLPSNFSRPPSGLKNMKQANTPSLWSLKASQASLFAACGPITEVPSLKPPLGIAKLTQWELTFTNAAPHCSSHGQEQSVTGGSQNCCRSAKIHQKLVQSLLDISSSHESSLPDHGVTSADIKQHNDIDINWQIIAAVNFPSQQRSTTQTFKPAKSSTHCWWSSQSCHVNLSFSQSLSAIFPVELAYPPELLQGLQHQDLEFQVLVFVWKAKTLKV